MKKALLAAALFTTVLSAPARAEKWMEMPNKAGGKILLLFQPCDDGKGKMVIATTPEGDNVQGCWFYFADMLHVVWTGGKTSSFNVGDFKLREAK